VDVGGGIFVKLMKTTETLSVLVPGQDDLVRRICIGPRFQELLWWFYAAEEQAWGYVENAYPNNRPDSIFLVVGQTLSSEYAICHQVNKSDSCEISVKANVAIPVVMESHFLLGYELEMVNASNGFQQMTKKQGSQLHTLFLKVHESAPIKMFRRTIKKLLLWYRLVRFSF